MSQRRIGIGSAFLGLAALAGCAGDPLPDPSAAFAPAPFPAWSEADPGYLLFPGDAIRIQVRTAPELSAELIVAPDGRIVLPVFGAVMAAGRTPAELKRVIEDIYGQELIDPELTLTPTAFASQKIFVGGEVEKPGVYDLPGEIGPLQAVLMAGGWTDEGRPGRVIVMRRMAEEVATRVVDVRGSLREPQLAAIGPLRRFDVIYVTRKAIADENLFMRQFVRDALPIDFGLYYDVSRL